MDIRESFYRALDSLKEASYRDRGYVNMLAASRKADKEADKIRAKTEKEASKKVETQTEETKYVVKGKSPFYKQDHYVNTHETPKAQLAKKHIKDATHMDLETAKKVAKDWESHPNKYKTEVVPVKEEVEQIDEISKKLAKSYLDKSAAEREANPQYPTREKFRGRMIGGATADAKLKGRVQQPYKFGQAPKRKMHVKVAATNEEVELDEAEVTKSAYHYYVTKNDIGPKKKQLTHSKNKPFASEKDAFQHILKSGGRQDGIIHKVHTETGKVVQNRGVAGGQTGYASDVSGDDPKHVRDLKEEANLDEGHYHVSWGQGLSHTVMNSKSSDHAVASAKAHLLKKIPKLADEKYSDTFKKKPRVTNITNESVDTSSKDATVKVVKANVTKDTNSTLPSDVKPHRVKLAQFKHLFN